MDLSLSCFGCVVIYENHVDFADIKFIEPSQFMYWNKATPLPSQMTDRDTLRHLCLEGQKQLLDLLDEFSACFSEMPNLCQLVLYIISTVARVCAERLRAYRVQKNLKSEVNQQIKEISRLGFITESNFPMVNPIVAVLKPSNSVRLCVNYQSLNWFTIPDQIPLPNTLGGCAENQKGTMHLLFQYCFQFS